MNKTTVKEVKEVIIYVAMFGPTTYREPTHGLIFLRQGLCIGKCLGYATSKSCLTSSIRPLTPQLMLICQDLNIPY